MPYEYYAVVHRALDGDTVEVTLSLGFSIHLGPKAMRLAGLNAPEIHDADPAIKKRAQAAMDFVVARLLPAANVPKVKIETEKPDADDKYGRLLGRVYYLRQPADAGKKRKKGTPAPQPEWINLNLELLAAGLVKPYDGTGVKPV